MTQSLNKALLIGNVGADPDVRTTASGRRVASFSLATSRRWTASPGVGVREKTEWHRVVAWDGLADELARTLRRGGRVFVEGRLEHRSWQDRSGRTRYTTEIIAQDVIPLDAHAVAEAAGDEEADLPF